MGRHQQFWIAAILLVVCCAADGPCAFASDEDSIQRVLASGGQAMLERHYRQAIHIFEVGLKAYPQDNRLRLELGRAYLATGSDGKAIGFFRQILQNEPGNRSAKLELARALGYDHQYGISDGIYQQLLSANASDETAAIELASNLLHQQRSTVAQDVVDRALVFHPNSLRLQEYKDRIESGQLGGEEREPVGTRNLVEADFDYVNDSAGNHSWRSSQRADFGIKPGLVNRLLMEQQFQHSLDDSLEVAETFTEEFRWKPRESLLLAAGGGAVRFDSQDRSDEPGVQALYEFSAAFRPREGLVLGTSFSRAPIIPDAEATEHRLTAQGWEAYASWAPSRWQIFTHWSRQNYSDQNIGSRQSLEVIREFGTPRLTFQAGYRYRRYSFDQQLAHGYFSPNSYQSHLAMAGVRFHPGKRYRGEFQVRSGMESTAADNPYGAAWEIHAVNQVLLGKWTLDLDYSRYRLVQDTGAFRADAARFAFTYHF